MKIHLGNKGEAQVELVVTLTNITYWQYRYKSDFPIYNSHKKNAPKRHGLGVVRNLIGDQDEWVFDLWNELDEDRRVTLKLEWYVDGQLAAVWIPDEAKEAKEGKEGKVTVKANSHAYFSSRCIFFN